MVFCDFCGAASDDSAASSPSDETSQPSQSQQVPLTWVTSVENGKERLYCDRCSRTHLRSIEAKLDAEWW